MSSNRRNGTRRTGGRRTGVLVSSTRVAAAVSILVGSVCATSVRADPARTDCPPEPHPCGGEWPDELVGRDDFELDRIDEVEVVADDGTVLRGWVALPRVPAGVKMPTVLSSSPYYNSVAGGTVYRDPTSPIEFEGAGANAWFSDVESPAFDVYTHSAGFSPQRLLRKGYAMAYFNVRGTGASSGCFDPGEVVDRTDQVKIIDWLESQTWSNGRVGMVGLSFPAYYSWQAAIEAPEALKTIVTAGDLIDLYQWVHTPQGSKSQVLADYWAQITANLTVSGGLIGGDTAVRGRAGCDPGRFARRDTQSVVSGDRSEHYATRTLSTSLGNVTAAVLDTSGYLDLLGHSGQDSTIWGLLDPRTPRVAIRGYWGHFYPTPHNPWATRLNFPSGTVDWEQYVTSWLDYWLKGVGPEPRTGVAYHQDQTYAWHEDTSWSPKPRDKEVLYLSRSGLSTAPEAGDVTFQSAPSPLDAQWFQTAAKSLTSNGVGGADDEGLNPSLCPSPLYEGLSHAYTTTATASPVLIAGNPFADVTVSSDQPGGIVTVSMYDVGPTFACSGSKVTGARFIASGSADLNFYETPFHSRDFPRNTPTEVRIDLTDTTYLLEAGHRLAVVLSNGGPFERSGSPFTPNITIHGPIGGDTARSSHIVVPVADGTLGGAHPTLQYPPRPFTKSGYQD